MKNIWESNTVIWKVQQGYVMFVFSLDFFEKTPDIDMMIAKIQIKPQRFEISKITSFNCE